MFCGKCGTETTDDSQFCRKCGKALGVSSTSSGAAAAVAPALIATKPKSKVRTPFKVAALLIFLFVLFLIVAARSAMNKNASSLGQLVKRQHTTTIDKPDLTVGSYNYFKLEVPTGAASVHLDGNFTASGGTGNDIEAYVLPESDFVNWQNHHAAKAFYNSGKVTVGKFSINLPADAGIYYLVFDNRFSLFSKKEVEVKGALTYYQ